MKVIRKIELDWWDRSYSRRKRETKRRYYKWKKESGTKEKYLAQKIDFKNYLVLTEQFIMLHPFYNSRIVERCLQCGALSSAIGHDSITRGARLVTPVTISVACRICIESRLVVLRSLHCADRSILFLLFIVHNYLLQ